MPVRNMRSECSKRRLQHAGRPPVLQHAAWSTVVLGCVWLTCFGREAEKPQHVRSSAFALRKSQLLKRIVADMAEWFDPELYDHGDITRRTSVAR